MEFQIVCNYLDLLGFVNKLKKFIKIKILNTKITNLPARMKEPTDEANPDKKALNGKVPTRRQYKNCGIPVKRM